MGSLQAGLLSQFQESDGGQELLPVALQVPLLHRLRGGLGAVLRDAGHRAGAVLGPHGQVGNY